MTIRHAFVIWLLGCVAGCQTSGLRVSARRPLVPPAVERPVTWQSTYQPTQPAVVPLENAWALQPGGISGADQAFRLGMQAEGVGDAQAVDHYYRATVLSWPGHFFSNDEATQRRSWSLYHQALAKFLLTAQRYDRFRPNGEIRINSPVGEDVVSTQFHAFAWSPSELDRLEFIDWSQSGPLRRRFRHPGFGLPMLAFQRGKVQDEERRQHISYAVTAVLEPGSEGHAAAAAPVHDSARGPIAAVATLKLFNPLSVRSISVGSRRVAIARDLSSSVESALAEGPEVNTMRRLLRPGTWSENNGVNFMEPYQPGKIPAVLIHGLASDRSTWRDLANELHALPTIREHYQFWTYEYSTGEPFLRSAMTCRESLIRTVHALDPSRQDVALDDMVLIGHSMGGLVAKLQVTYSSDTIWRAAAQQPFETMRGDAALLDETRRLFFFDPLPFVRRVVFIGTPHAGSAWANRLVGRFSSGLIRQPDERNELHRRLVAANPQAIRPAFQQRIPSSIDLLEPSSPLLDAMRLLSLGPGVQLHSIIGTARGGAIVASDGVVPVSSARHVPVESERFVNASHTGLLHHRDTVREVDRILTRHLQQSQMSAAASRPVRTRRQHTSLRSVERIIRP